ncbi:hypothetical protein, partial [Mesorhizobium abyssinicae]|uniref:hypothetical protein n=1 Tax=Mesorhizobium abyssinicae TaxID=1209958 RepID=UPI003CF8F200
DHHTGQRLLERPRGKGLREERTRSPNIRLESFLHRGRQPEKNVAGFVPTPTGTLFSLSKVTIQQ